jgi:bromodomain-containing factor 1
MLHPSSSPFRRPVNASVLKLKDYHKIIKKPIDLGTIYSRCILGKYNELQDVTRNVILMVTIAKMFTPPDHFVHSMASDVLNLFNSELDAHTKAWSECLHWDSLQA